MSRRGIRRFIGTGRWIVTALLVALAALGAWSATVRGWPFGAERDPVQPRLDSAGRALTDYRERVEAALRLQLLEAALVDGRRSAALRNEFRLLEERLEGLLARESIEDRGELEAELAGIQPDLTRNRRAARESIERLSRRLLSPAGPGRQGGG